MPGDKGKPAKEGRGTGGVVLVAITGTYSHCIFLLQQLNADGRETKRSHILAAADGKFRRSIPPSATYAPIQVVMKGTQSTCHLPTIDWLLIPTVNAAPRLGVSWE